MRRSAQAFGALAGLWGIAAWLLPVGVGRAAFGASWPGVHHILLPASVSFAGGGVAMAAFAGIRAMADARRGLLARVSVGVMGLAAGSVGAAIAGAMGAFVALAITTPVGILTWWIYYRRAFRGPWGSEQRWSPVVVPAFPIEPAWREPG